MSIFCYTCPFLTAIPSLSDRNVLKAKKSAIVYGDVYESRAIVFVLPHFWYSLGWRGLSLGCCGLQRVCDSGGNQTISRDLWFTTGVLFFYVDKEISHLHLD